MSRDQVISIFRNLLSLGSGILVGKGIITAEQAASLAANLSVAVPAIVGIVSVVWGVISNSPANKIKSVERIPEVTAVTVKNGTNGKIGALVASPKNPKVTDENGKKS